MKSKNKIELPPLCVSAAEVKAVLKIGNGKLYKLVRDGEIRKAAGLPNRYVWASVLRLVEGVSLKGGRYV